MKKTMRIWIMAGICCCANLVASAQQTNAADSLLSAFNQEKSDTAKVSIQNALIKEYLKIGQMNRAKQTVKEMLSLAAKTHNKLYIALANNAASNAYTTDRNLDSTLFFANRALSLLKDESGNKATHIKITSNNNIAVAYSTTGDMKKSVEILVRNLKLIQEIKDDNLYHLTIHNISASFVMMSQDDKAYNYMLQDVALADKPGSSLRLQILAYLNATVVCYNLKKFEEQKYYLDKSEKALLHFGDSRLWPQYYAYQAMYYSGIQQPENALAAANKALTESKKYDDRQNEYLAYEAIRDAQAAMKNYEKAKAAAQKIYQMGMEDEYIEAAIIAAKNMSEFSFAMGNYKDAYQYSERYNHLKDSAQLRQDAQKISELETQLRTLQKEEKIAKLESEKREASLHIKDQKLTNTLLAAGCLFLLITLGIGLLFYRNNKRDALQKEKIKMAETMLNTQEAERERIARDLHDGLVGTLSGIRMNLGILTNGAMDATTKNGIANAVNQLGSSIGELRHIAHNMMPEMLLRLGLEAALKDLCHMLETAGIRVQQEFINLKQPIATEKEVIIYRIVQELFANVIKHAKAANVFFQCAIQGKIFLITVEDDGIGLKRQVTKKNKGIGLKNVESRVHYLNGNIDISPLAGEKGTSINIQLNVSS